MYVKDRSEFHITNFGDLKRQWLNPSNPDNIFRHIEDPSSRVCSVVNQNKIYHPEMLLERDGRRYTFDFAHSTRRGDICFKVHDLSTSLDAQDTDNFLFAKGTKGNA